MSDRDQQDECPKAFYCLPESCGDCPRDQQDEQATDPLSAWQYKPAEIGLLAISIEYAVQEWGRQQHAEGERAATERMADDWYEMRDVLQSTVDSLESALRRVEFYEVDRPRKPKQHRTVQRARALLARTADAIERGDHEQR